MNSRLKQLFQGFNNAGIDALLVSSWPNVTYLSGFRNTESWLLVSPKGLYFITDSRYAEQAQREAVGFKVLLRDQKSMFDLLADLVKKQKIRKLGFEAPIVTHSFYLGLAKALGPDKLKATAQLVERLRETKDASEIAKIKKSAKVAVKGFCYVRDTVRVGMTERDIQARLEHYTKTLGSEKPAFDIIIASAARSSMPHAQTDHHKVVNNNLVLVDMGVVVEGYHSDLTRPVYLGKIPPLLKEIHDVVWEAQRAGIAKAAPGVPASEVDAVCRNIIKKRGYGSYFGHSTGHGVGLEIHESPGVASKSDKILKPGMVITVEPGIYLPGRFGVRIEDMVLIKEKGNEVLTDGLD
jgi:Xaa-Pro aminopeptidase